MTLSKLFARPYWGLAALLIAVLPAPTLAEPVVLGGVGSLTPVAKILGLEYAKKHPGFEFSVIEPPMGTKAGLRALAAGKLDIAIAARPNNPDEAGEAKAWLQTPLVLAMSGDKSMSLTRTQIADIYAGKKTAWDNKKPIRLVLRGDQETETKVLRSMSPAIDLAVTEVLKRRDLPIAENDIEALDALARISGSLGTTNLGLIKVRKAPVAAVTIDGLVPSVSAMEAGLYPWKRQFYLVTGAKPRPATLKFLAWLHSPEALAIARSLDYLPMPQ